MAVEAQGHKMQSSGLVQRLVVLWREQQVPASLSPSPAGIYIYYYLFFSPACGFLCVPGSRGR